MAEPQFGSNVAPLLPQSERYEQFKKQQDAVMKQHQQYSAQLEQRQQQVDAKKGDLDIAGRMMKILDSRLPKPARQFLARELAQHVGADPKTEQVKNVSGMLTSLDPDSLQGLRSGLAMNLEQSQPGEIAQTVQGILSGKVPMDKFIEQVGPAMMQGGEGEDQLAGGEGSDQLGGGEPAEAPTAPAPFQAGDPNAIRSLEGQRTVSPVDQPVSPGIVGALGLDSTQIYRHRDLTQGGYKVPFDPKDQDKLAEELNTRTTGLSATISEATKMVDIFEGHPEVLGTVGSGVQTIQTIVQQVQGALNIIRPGATNDTDITDPKIQSLTREVSTKIAKMHGIDVTAANAAQVDSMALGLAYKMAIANDIPGNRLTNVILEQNLRQIGQSGSPQQFKAVLANTLASTTREFNEAIKRKTGVNGTDVMARQMSDGDLNTLAQRAKKDRVGVDADPNAVEMLPRELRESMVREIIRRKEGGKGPSVTPSSPTIDEEQQRLGKSEMDIKAGKAEQQDQTLRLEREREERLVRGEGRAEVREERLTKSAEANAKTQQEAAEFNRAEHERDNAFAREQFEHSKGEQARDNSFQREQFDYRKQQDLKQADMARQDKIAAAFRHFGAAISGRSGGGGGVGVPSLGGGQDVSAFRMTPAPQRIPPKPGGR